MAFPNVGFIGYPVAVALFGPEALFYAVILVLPFNLMAFTLGPLMLVCLSGIFCRCTQILELCSPGSVRAGTPPQQEMR